MLVVMLAVFATVMFTACGSNDEPEPEPETPVVEDTTPDPDPIPEEEDEDEEEVVEEEDEEEEVIVEEPFVVQIPIVSGIGALSGSPTYEFDRNIAGEALPYNHSVQFGWDGVDTLYVRATINQVDGTQEHDRPADAYDWWADDTFEVFLVPNVPEDEMTNRATAWQWATNANNVFTYGLRAETRDVSTSLDGTTWTVEWAIALDQELLFYINQRGFIFGKVAASLQTDNALLGVIGGFWTVDNYIQFDFQQGPMSAVRIPQVGGFNDFDNARTYYFTHRSDGSRADFRHQVQMGWNGSDTMFVRYTVLHGHGVIYNELPFDSSVWWEDDVAEVFIQPTMPADEAENRGTARQWMTNSETMFYGYGSLQQPAAVTHFGFEDDQWIVELTLELDEDTIAAIEANGHAYGKFTISLNSNSEWMLLGQMGGFWIVDNYSMLIFE